MKKIFVCSKFSGDVEKNIKLARKYCRELCMRGYAPFAPHLFYTQFLNDDKLREREMGINCGDAWMEACDEVWVYLEPGDHPSDGMKKDITYASIIGKKIVTIYRKGKK